MNKQEAFSYYASQLEDIRNSGVLKAERIITTPQSAHIFADGKELLNMCANNYLGLADNRELAEAAKAAYDTYGYGMASVRFICGTQSIHKKLEAAVARFLGTEDTILYSSCFDANGGLFEVLLTAEDAVISDELNHASIIDGIRLCKAKRYRYKNNDMADLEAQLQAADAAGARIKLIATDGVFSMGGDIAKLPEITTLAKKYGARVMVDDAHAFGVIGEGGRGSASYFGLEQEIDIYMGTFSKSMASLGGYMAADARVCDYVRCNSRPYIFSASVPPANIAVATAALRHLKAHPELPRQLLDISQYMRDGLHARGVKIIDADTPIIPIYTYDPIVTLKAQKELYERGVYVNATLPPACAPGECLLRCTLMATHTKALVDEAVDIIADVLHQYDL